METYKPCSKLILIIIYFSERIVGRDKFDTECEHVSLLAKLEHQPEIRIAYYYSYILVRCVRRRLVIFAHVDNVCASSSSTPPKFSIYRV